MNFDCANITNKNVSAHTEENKIWNEEDKCNNCERNTRGNKYCDRNTIKNNKIVDKNASK